MPQVQSVGFATANGEPALTPSEVTLLTELEGVIQRGLTTFVKVGDALFRIRYERLYRQSHGTFEDYCRDRWGMTSRRANQLVQGAEVGTIVPVQNEAQARELAPLRDNPERLKEAWEEANARASAEGRAPTARDLRKSVQAIVRPIKELQAQWEKLDDVITARPVKEPIHACVEPYKPLPEGWFLDMTIRQLEERLAALRALRDAAVTEPEK